MPIQRPVRAARALLLAAAFGLSPQALAQGIYVESFSQSAGWTALPGFPSKALGQPGLPSGSDILITIPDSASLRVYADNPETTDIGLITLRTGANQLPTLIVGKAQLPQTSATSSISGIGCRNLAGVIANERARAQIHATSITGPGVEVHQLVRLDLTGDLSAPVIHWADKATPAPALGAVDIKGSVTPAGSIGAYAGAIGPVTIGGDLNGHITARQGAIASIDVAGDIGSAGRPVIWATAPMNSFAIDRVVAGGTIGRPGAFTDIVTGGAVRVIEADAFHANIDLEANPAIPGFLAGVTARTGGYEGSLRARSLTSFGGWNQAPCLVSIAGDLSGEIVFTNVVRNERAAGPEIDIAGRVTEGSTIVVGAMPITNPSLPAGEIRVRTEQGLSGQIIVGKGSATDFPEPALVQIGTSSPRSITSATKFYETLFAEFGGGAVGIAPFNFHTQESFPKHNATITLASNELLVAAAPRFFGPVFTDIGAEMVVEHLAPGASAWVDRSAEFETECVTDELGDRSVVVHALAPASFTAGAWRLRPVAGTILSARAIGTPEVRFDSEHPDDTYRFTVAGGSNCPPPPGRDPEPIVDNQIDFTDADAIIRANCP